MVNETVFVVDDDVDSRSALGEVLELENFRAVLFSTGWEMLDHLAAEMPAVIVMDLVMPGLSDWDLARILRKDARWRGIPIVIFTAWDDREADPRLRIPVVAKPDINRLLTAIRTATQSRHGLPEAASRY